jgi:hypothetical protein
VPTFAALGGEDDALESGRTGETATKSPHWRMQQRLAGRPLMAAGVGTEERGERVMRGECDRTSTS